MDGYIVRPLRPGEEQDLPVSAGQTGTFVVQSGSSIVGGIGVELLCFGKKGQIGYVGWLHADDRRMAGPLLDAAARWCKEQGCRDLCACIGTEELSLSAQFAEQGFGPLSLGGQAKRFGCRLPTLWHRTGRLTDLGHLLWHRDLMHDNDLPVLPSGPKSFLSTVAGNTLLWIACLRGWNLLHLVGLRTGHPLWGAGPGYEVTLPAILVPAFFLLLRSLATELSAKVQELDIRFRGADGIWLTAFLVAFLTGFPFPVPGTFLPAGASGKQDGTKGKLAMLSRSSQLALGIGCLFFVRSFALRFALPLLAIDTLFFFRPFSGSNARRLLDGGSATISGSYALLLVVSFFVLV
jgi:hypothetical protein